MGPTLRDGIINYVTCLRLEDRLIKGAYCDNEDNSFCMVGGISDYLRSTIGETKEQWEKFGNYHIHQQICDLVTGLSIESLHAMDVIFEGTEELSEEDFKNTLLLMRNINWNLPKIYTSMIRTVYSNLYTEAGMARNGYAQMQNVTWENWPELRGELRRKLPKGFMYEFDFYMIDTLLNPKDMEFNKILALYMKGNYGTTANLIQKLKSHTTWDPKGDSL